MIADVGQNAREEVNWEPTRRGRPQLRMAAARRPRRRTTRARRRRISRSTEPIHDYPRSDGMSITGGFVYRGAALDPMFNGRYFFADYVAGRVFTIGLALDERQEATRRRPAGADRACWAAPPSSG